MRVLAKRKSVKLEKEKKKITSLENKTRLVKMFPQHQGFHFYRDVGRPTGKTAVSLSDFVDKLKSVDIRSINFHFKRKDFEKWIRDVINDVELCRRISRIRKEAHGEKLRNEIIQIMKGRLEELKGTQTKA